MSEFDRNANSNPDVAQGTMFESQGVRAILDIKPSKMFDFLQLG